MNLPAIEPSMTDNAISVMKKRYFMKDESGQVLEGPRDLFERVAVAIGRADIQYSEDPAKSTPHFYSMLSKLEFLPNTPCLVNAGRADGQLAACFVLPVDDHMESIMDTLKHTAMIHKSGGGTGFSFSRLRPGGDFVTGTNGVASGPVSFMRMYNDTTDCVKQGGIRRGANMGILRVDHPDILQFIDCKRTACAICADMGETDCEHNITNFNISVGITDAFMAALASGGEFDLVHPRSKLTVKKLSARAVWDRIVENAHFIGDPGLFFIDRVNAADPLHNVPGLPPIEATNPCGEVPLRPYTACTLGSINLSKFYAERSGQPTVDFERLGKVVHQAVHFLDNVLTVNCYPIPQIAEQTTAQRKVGLGVMGWADLLMQLGIRYDSDRAFNLAEQTMQLINNEAVQASEDLAQRRGTFTHWEGSQWQKRGDKPRRNSTVTVIAPTGSISIIAGCSSGIEPLFAIAMVRNQAGMEMPDVNPFFIETAKREGWYSEQLMMDVARTGRVGDNPKVPAQWREVFRTAGEISADGHVRMQAAFQKHTEDAVSKTINLPKGATRADVETAYMRAWEQGCKGITVYRDGCRRGQVLNISKVNKGGPASARPERRRIPSNGRRVGETISKETAYGTVHNTINLHPDDGEPFECFTTLGKQGAEVNAFAAAFGRSASLLLSIDSPVPPRRRLELLGQQMKGIGGGGQVGMGEAKIMSIPDGISCAISEYLETPAMPVEVCVSAAAVVASTAPVNGRSNGHSNGNGHGNGHLAFDVCPSCHLATLAKGGGCDSCVNPDCGYSKC